MDEKNQISGQDFTSLPERIISISGTKRKVRIDSAANRIYLLDDNGNYTGKSAVFTPTASNLSTESVASQAVPMDLEDNFEPKGPPAGSSKSTSPREPEAIKPKNTTILSPIRLVALLLAAITACTVLSCFWPASERPSEMKSYTESTKGESRPKPDSETGLSLPPWFNSEPEPTAEPATDPTPAPETEPPKHVTVLCANKEYFPGDPLKAISSIAMTADEYTAHPEAEQLYLSEDAPLITGMVATAYIPAGELLTQNNVGAAYAPVNPWEPLEGGYRSWTAPITTAPGSITSHLWGNVVTLDISVKSWGSSTPALPESPIEGLEVSRYTEGSATVTVYRVEGAVVRDVYNLKGFSLYCQYHMISLLPLAVQQSYLAQRYSNAVRVSEDTPASINIALTEQQYELLVSLNQKYMVVQVTKTGSVCGSTEQTEAYPALQGAGQVIGDAMQIVN